MNNDAEENQAVVITGATKGLGKALSLEFAGAGYEVIGIYRADSENAKTVETEFEAKGLRGVLIKKDITEDGDWEEFDKIIKAGQNKIFTLIANASPPFVPKPLHLLDWPDISKQIEVNLKGTFQIFKRLLPLMVKSRKGTVVSVLTTALNNSPKGFTAYLTAKAALEGLTKAIAAEYALRGIRVFSVSPGFMETSLTGGWSEHLKALITSGNDRISQPEKVAAAILNLTKDPNTAGQGEDYLLDKMPPDRIL